MSPSDDTGSLEARAIAQFDSLIKKGELFWEPTEEIRIKQEPFDLHFRISPITTSKPYNPHNTSKRPGFLDDDPEFTLQPHVSPYHKLIMNKFCWLRPQMILHTAEFESQTDLLTIGDFEAAWGVLRELGGGNKGGKGRYMIIFNGGPEAGSSVAHKHLQVFPRPEWRTAIDDFLASKDGDGASSSQPLTIPTLPFIHLIHALPPTTTPATIYASYTSMTSILHISTPSDAAPSRPHNMIMTQEWITVFPRSCGTIHGDIPNAPLQGGANALIGMEWLKTPEQFENWKAYGPMKVLTALGVATREYEDETTVKLN